MGFHKPEPFVYATRNLGEQIRRVGVVQRIRLVNRLARACCPNVDSARATALHMRHALRNLQR
jgi:hypothetical protein